VKDKAKQKEKQSNPAPEEKTSQAAPSKASKKTAPMEEEDKDEKKEGKKETKKSEHQLVPVSKVENSRGNKRAANAALEPENAPDGSERPAKRTAAALEVAKNKRKEREVEEQEWTNQISVPTL